MTALEQKMVDAYNQYRWHACGRVAEIETTDHYQKLYRRYRRAVISGGGNPDQLIREYATRD